ncbi:MAG TPA: hypothetical protein VFJ14_07325 [Nocardioidaceae bacterium]|nr:hypothetical protein [Nocardioidaceae bacterium]
MPDPEVQRTSPWIFRLVPAATFVVGLVLGALVTWAGSSDPLEFNGSEPAPTPTAASTPPSAEPTQSPPAACLDAADAVEEAVRLMREAAAATRDFQPEKLVDVLNQLETLDPRLRGLAERCSGVAPQSSSQ